MNKTIRDLFTQEEWEILTEKSVPELCEIEDYPLPDNMTGVEEAHGSQ